MTQGILFSKQDLQTRLYPSSPAFELQQRQRTARVTRLIAKLRGHGLIAEVKDSRLYRLTAYGARLMSAALHCRNKEFPRFALAAA